MAESIILEQKPALGLKGINVSRKRLYIFPTRHGLVFGIMLAVMMMGAINYTNSMAYMLTFLLISLFLVCILHTYRNLRGLIVSTNNARSVFAGEIAEFPIIFDNRNSPQRSSISIHPWPTRRKRKKIQQNGVEYTRIDTEQLVRDVLPMQTTSRGYLKPERLRIHSAYPLGLFRAWSYLSCKSFCLVFPKPEGDSRLPYFTEHTTQDQKGEQIGTDDFIGFRQYRPGDSIRNIDWKILAREQGVMVKKFSGSGARQLIIHWDQTSHLDNIEKKISQLALWIIRAEKNGLRYGLVLPDIKIDLDHGEKHQLKCLGMLAEYGQDKNI
ncbi:MAG: hypothetical protein ACI9XC_000624 [Gammaproteobacteria bacterium]